MDSKAARTNEGEHGPALAQALSKLRTELAPLYTDLPVEPALSELNTLIDHLNAQPLPQWSAALFLDDPTYAGLGKLAMKYDCSPRVVFTAIILCVARDQHC